MNATFPPEPQRADRPAGPSSPPAADPWAEAADARRDETAAATDQPREGFWGHYVTDRLRHFSLD